MAVGSSAGWLGHEASSKNKHTKATTLMGRSVYYVYRTYKVNIGDPHSQSHGFKILVDFKSTVGLSGLKLVAVEPFI